MPATDQRYVIVSPVKDEGAHLERALHSVIAQSVRPYRWIIVDDGSRDNTAELLAACARQHSWIEVISRSNSAERGPGPAVIRAFQSGYASVEHLDFDFIVKLDADLELPVHYFEALLQHFSSDPSLGIASGVYLEQANDRWVVIPMPDYHAAGASKMIRMKCFRDIGGFIPHRGWDTVDEIRAQTLGWTTRHFDDLQFLHLKPEGSGIGRYRTSVMQGEVYYLTGGGAFFFALKIIQRMLRNRPLLISGLMMLAGYLRAALSRRPRLVTEHERRCYRQRLNGRIWDQLLRFWPWCRSARQPWRYA